MSFVDQDSLTTISDDASRHLPPIMIRIPSLDYGSVGTEKNKILSKSIICARCKMTNAINFSFCSRCGYVLNRSKLNLLSKSLPGSSSSMHSLTRGPSDHIQASKSSKLMKGGDFDEEGSVSTASSSLSAKLSADMIKAFQASKELADALEIKKRLKAEKRAKSHASMKANPKANSFSASNMNASHKTGLSTKVSSPKSMKKIPSLASRRKQSDAGVESIGSNDISDVGTFMSEDLEHLDMPDPVKRALNLDLSSFRLNEQQHEQLREKLWRADVLELTNAELIERMYHLNDSMMIPRTESNLSVESIDSISNVKGKRLKSKTSMHNKSQHNNSLYLRALERESKYRRYNDSYMADIESAASLREKARALEAQSFSIKYVGSNGSIISSPSEYKPGSRQNVLKEHDNISFDASMFDMSSIQTMDHEIGSAFTGELQEEDKDEVILQENVVEDTTVNSNAEGGQAWLWGDCLHLNQEISSEANDESVSRAALKKKKSKKKISPKHIHQQSLPAEENSIGEDNSTVGAGSFYWGNLIPQASEDAREDVLALFDEMLESDNEEGDGVAEKDEVHDSQVLEQNEEDNDDHVEDADKAVIPTPTKFLSSNNRILQVQDEISNLQDSISTMENEQKDYSSIEDRLVMKRSQSETFDHHMLVDMSRQYLAMELERKFHQRSTLEIIMEELGSTQEHVEDGDIEEPGAQDTLGGIIEEDGDNGDDDDDDDEMVSLQRKRKEIQFKHDENLALIEDMLQQMTLNNQQVHTVVNEGTVVQGNTSAKKQPPTIEIFKEKEAEEVHSAFIHRHEDSLETTQDQQTQEVEVKEMKRVQMEDEVANINDQVQNMMNICDTSSQKRNKTLSAMTAAARMQKIRVERHHDSPLKSSMKLKDERGELLVNAANLTEKDLSPEFNSNLGVGKMFMISFERMRKCIAQIGVDFREDINTWDAIQLDGLQLQIDTAKLALSLAHEVSVTVAKEVKLFHERASLQRTTIAYNISEHFMKASKLEKFFRDQYEAEKQEYFKLFGPSVLKANKQRLENDEMKAIQEQANQSLQQLGEQIKELQDAEAQIIRGLKQEEFAIMETINHWRPKHSKRITELTIGINRAEGWLKSRVAPTLSSGFSFAGMDEDEDD